MSDAWIMLIGVSAGWVLSVCTPAATRWLARKRRRRALALLVCPLLEQFMLACQAVIDDEGEQRQGNRHPSVPMPTGPEFPADVDWTSIDPRLANRILWLRSAATRAEQELRYVDRASVALIRPKRSARLECRRGGTAETGAQTHRRDGAVR